MTGTRSVGATVSAAVHAAAILALILVTRFASDVQQSAPGAALLPRQLIWFPHDVLGGGSDGGGSRSAAPPRQMEAPGRDARSAPSPQSASIDSNIEPLEVLQALPVVPMGSAVQMVPGAIESSGISAGPGDSGVGSTTAAGQGPGNKPDNGFGDAMGVGGPGVTAPTVIERATPKYTIEAMQARIQGIALVECVVQTDGTVGDARIIRSLDRRFGLDEEALRAARRWRFRPGLLKGKPVPVVVTIELMFSIR